MTNPQSGFFARLLVVLKISWRWFTSRNVTSQLFANIYLNELDQFMKHRLKAKHYLRYCDDFIILGDDQVTLNETIGEVGDFYELDLNCPFIPAKLLFEKADRV